MIILMNKEKFLSKLVTKGNFPKSINILLDISIANIIVNGKIQNGFL